MWILHHRNIAHIAATQKPQMRRYLQTTRDWAMLTEWDNAQMADKLTDTTTTNSR